MAFGFDAVRIHFNGQSERPIKAAGRSFSTMQTGIFRVLHGFGAREADRAALHLKFQVGLINARNLSDEHEIIALAEDVHRRITAAAAWT